MARTVTVTDRYTLTGPGVFLDAEGRLWCFLETDVPPCINSSMTWSGQGVIFPPAAYQTRTRMPCPGLWFDFKGNARLSGEEQRCDRGPCHVTTSGHRPAGLFLLYLCEGFFQLGASRFFFCKEHLIVGSCAS